MKTYKVVLEHDDHLYALNTLIKPLYSFGENVEYAWYIDEEGIAQIMHRSEIMEVVK